MGLVALVGAGVLGWLILTGRLTKPTGAQMAALAVALIGALLAARGRPVVGGAMLIGGLGWLSFPRGRTAMPENWADRRTRDALDLLGLPVDASRDQVVEAHRRLITRNHPDAGGTDALARQINAARDHLLRRLPD